MRFETEIASRNTDGSIVDMKITIKHQKSTYTVEMSKEEIAFLGLALSEALQEIEKSKK